MEHRTSKELDIHLKKRKVRAGPIAQYCFRPCRIQHYTSRYFKHMAVGGAVFSFKLNQNILCDALNSITLDSFKLIMLLFAGRKLFRWSYEPTARVLLCQK